MQLLSIYKLRKNWGLNLISTNQTQTLIFPVGVNGNLQADSAMWLLLETSLGPASSFTRSFPCVQEVWCLRRGSLCGTSTCAGQMPTPSQLAAARRDHCLQGFHFPCLHPALSTVSLWCWVCLPGFSNMSHQLLPLHSLWHNSQHLSGASAVRHSARSVWGAEQPSWSCLGSSMSPSSFQAFSPDCHIYFSIVAETSLQFCTLLAHNPLWPKNLPFRQKSTVRKTHHPLGTLTLYSAQMPK